MASKIIDLRPVRSFVLSIGVIALAIFFAQPCANAATVDEALKSLRNLSGAQRQAALEEGAKKEGEVVWYTSMSLTDFPKIVGAFEKAVPYVKVKSIRLLQSTILPKIDTEARAGRYAVDLVSSAPVEIWELKRQGHSAAYLSPELKAFPAGSYDPQGYWSSFEVTPIVLAFNTKLAPLDEAPRTYQDLLLPKNMNMGSGEYGVKIWGQIWGQACQYGVRRAYLTLLLALHNLASLWQENRGCISPARSIMSCVAVIRGSRSLPTIRTGDAIGICSERAKNDMATGCSLMC